MLYDNSIHIIETSSAENGTLRRRISPPIPPSLQRASHDIPSWIEAEIVSPNKSAVYEDPRKIKRATRARRNKVSEKENASWDEWSPCSNPSVSLEGSRCRLFGNDHGNYLLPYLNTKTATNAALIGRNMLCESTFATCSSR